MELYAARAARTPRVASAKPGQNRVRLAHLLYFANTVGHECTKYWLRLVVRLGK